MNIVIRVDSSTKMGTGHIMRCITFANELKKSGAKVKFITRNLNGNISEVIRENKFGSVILSTPSKKYNSIQESHDYEDWLEVPWEKDAVETIEGMKDEQVDWLIIDHYAINRNWEAKLLPYTKKLMVIDDIANRQHYCHLLLDQNLGKKEDVYRKLVPKDCQLLLGPEYAMLRPEFREIRSDALKRRMGISVVKKILVTLGGTDPDNVTRIVLEGIALSNMRDHVEIDVLMGSKNPHQNRIRELLRNLNINASVTIDAKNMAERMKNADLAIGAGGTTSWERCCLGLPTIVVINADNQVKIVEELELKKAVINMGSSKDITPEHVAMLLNRVTGDYEKLREISFSASNIVDGLGVKKVVESMLIN